MANFGNVAAVHDGDEAVGEEPDPGRGLVLHQHLCQQVCVRTHCYLDGLPQQLGVRGLQSLFDLEEIFLLPVLFLGGGSIGSGHFSSVRPNNVSATYFGKLFG